MTRTYPGEDGIEKKTDAMLVQLLLSARKPTGIAILQRCVLVSHALFHVRLLQPEKQRVRTVRSAFRDRSLLSLWVRLEAPLAQHCFVHCLFVCAACISRCCNIVAALIDTLDVATSEMYNAVSNCSTRTAHAIELRRVVQCCNPVERHFVPPPYP